MGEGTYLRLVDRGSETEKKEGAFKKRLLAKRPCFICCNICYNCNMSQNSNKDQIVELGASEGVFTAAQAERLGIPRYALSYAVKAHNLEKVAHGAYRLVSSIDDGLDGVRAAYKLTDPSKFTHERIGGAFDGIVVSGKTAAYMLGIGNYHADPYSIITSVRFNSRRKNVMFRTAAITPREVVWLEGVPVTRPERTIADLYSGGDDVSLVAQAFVDAVRKYGATQFDIRNLQKMIGIEAIGELCTAAGITGTSARLEYLDDEGHVAILKGEF